MLGLTRYCTIIDPEDMSHIFGNARGNEHDEKTYSIKQILCNVAHVGPICLSSAILLIYTLLIQGV